MAQIGLEGGLFMNLLVSRKKLLGNTRDFLWSYGGYLIVSALCDLCGVVLDESNARNFITDCIESLHDTLKDNLNINGVNYADSLNDDLISKFIEFYKGKEDVPVSSNILNGSFIYNIKPFTKSTEICSFTASKGGTCYFKSFSDKVSCSLSSTFKAGDIVSYRVNWDVNSYSYVYEFCVYINNSSQYSNYNYTMDYFSNNNGFQENFTLTFDTSFIKEGTFKSFVGATYPSVLGDVSNLEEYKAKYENKPSRIILDSSIVNIKTKWKKEDTDIYIPNGNVENLPSGVNVAYRQYLFKEGDQCTNITGGWKDYYISGAQFTDTCILLAQSETHNMFAGTINEIDFSKYTKMYLDMESTNYCYVLNQTALSPESTWFYFDYSQGTNRKIVSFNLGEDKKISTKIYCAIFETGTAKIYNIWLE